MEDNNYLSREYIFNTMSPYKLSFSFTWDDNFETHIKWIAPVFESYQKRCTFFVNPGEPDYQEFLGNKYAQLANQGFEIGSHGYTHHHFSHLTDTVYDYQLTKSKEAIFKTTGVIPLTFAFPHHDFTTQMLSKAKKIYFETRNTLHNTPRFSFKSNTSLETIQKAIDGAISDKHSLVFSGHSIYINANIQNCDGYEPIPLSLLSETLKIILQYDDVSEICTFSQASLKEYICSNCTYTDKTFYINNNQLSYLQQFGLTTKRIEELA